MKNVIKVLKSDVNKSCAITMEAAMNEQILICMSCNKIENENGVWLDSESSLTDAQANSLCPECCHEKFPQFYSDYKKPKSSNSSLKDILSKIACYISTPSLTKIKSIRNIGPITQKKAENL